MNIVRHRPTAALAPWIDCLWYNAGTTPSTRQRSALPTGAMDVVLNLDGDSLQILSGRGSSLLRTDGALVHGAQSSYFIIPARPPGRTVGIHFRPGGGTLVLGIPASELAEQHVSLSDVWGASAAQVRAQLSECSTSVEIFHLLEQALLARLRHLHAPLVNPAISFALRSFSTGHAVNRVAPIQEATGYSARRFNTLFEQAVGLSPKRFCRIQRLRAVIEQLARGERIEWARLAADNGYFDQSHLNREFRQFSGVTPARYKPAARDSALHMELP